MKNRIDKKLLKIFESSGYKLNKNGTIIDLASKRLDKIFGVNKLNPLEILKEYDKDWYEVIMENPSKARTRWYYYLRDLNSTRKGMIAEVKIKIINNAFEFIGFPMSHKLHNSS